MPPKCKKCRQETVLADAGVISSIPYFYCRTCKKEVSSLGYEVKELSVKELSELNDYFDSIYNPFFDQPLVDDLNFVDLPLA